MSYETFRYHEIDVILDFMHLVFKYVVPNFINILNESKIYIQLEDIVHRAQDVFSKTWE